MRGLVTKGHSRHVSKSSWIRDKAFYTADIWLVLKQHAQESVSEYELKESNRVACSSPILHARPATPTDGRISDELGRHEMDVRYWSVVAGTTLGSYERLMRL